MRDLPMVKTCPFCGCQMFFEVDADGPDYEFGDSGYETATISGQHETQLFSCPFSQTEENGVMYDLTQYKSLQAVADEWNRRFLEDGPDLPLRLIMEWKRPLIIKAWQEGLSARACARIFDVSHDMAAVTVRGYTRDADVIARFEGEKRLDDITMAKQNITADLDGLLASREKKQ